MIIDDIYKLVIEHLVQGYPVSLEHYGFPRYKANKHANGLNRIMLIDINREATIKWDDTEKNQYGWDHQEIFNIYDCG